MKTLAAGLAALLLCTAAIAQNTFNVLGELTPSATRPFEEKADLSRSVMRDLPLAELAALFGLDARWAYRSGGYQGSISPNLVASIDAGPGEQGRVRAFALAWMYVYQQEAVPFFRVADSGMTAMRLRFEGSLTPAGERSMYASLIDALGEEAGYTRTAEREIVVIDFARHNDFLESIREFAKQNRIVQIERLAVDSEYPSHDWQADRRGEALLAEVRRLSNRDVEPALRAMHARYEEIVAGWLARLAACCPSRSTPQQFASSGR